MIKVVYLGINVSDCQLAECLCANANGKWLLVMCEVAYWYNNSSPSLRLPLPPFHLLPVWVRKIPGWLLRGPLCSWTKGLLTLSGWQSAWFPAWGHSVGGEREEEMSFRTWIGDYAGCLGWRQDELGWREFVYVHKSQLGLVSTMFGKLIWTVACQASSLLQFKV